MVHQYLVRHEAGQNGCLVVFGLCYRLEQTVRSDDLIGVGFGGVSHGVFGVHRGRCLGGGGDPGYSVGEH